MNVWMLLLAFVVGFVCGVATLSAYMAQDRHSGYQPKGPAAPRERTSETMSQHYGQDEDGHLHEYRSR